MQPLNALFRLGSTRSIEFQDKFKGDSKGQGDKNHFPPPLPNRSSPRPRSEATHRTCNPPPTQFTLKTSLPQPPVKFQTSHQPTRLQRACTHQPPRDLVTTPHPRLQRREPSTVKWCILSSLTFCLPSWALVNPSAEPVEMNELMTVISLVAGISCLLLQRPRS